MDCRITYQQIDFPSNTKSKWTAANLENRSSHRQVLSKLWLHKVITVCLYFTVYVLLWEAAFVIWTFGFLLFALRFLWRIWQEVPSAWILSKEPSDVETFFSRQTAKICALPWLALLATVVNNERAQPKASCALRRALPWLWLNGPTESVSEDYNFASLLGSRCLL